MRLLVILVWCMSCADDHPTAIPSAPVILRSAATKNLRPTTPLHLTP